jgi:hypothetical protein
MSTIDYETVMHELLGLWGEGLEADSWEVRADGLHRSVPVIVRGLVAHTVDCGRATTVLYGSGLPAAAMPLIRAMLEDVITAEWIVENKEAWQAFRKANAIQRAGSLKDFISREPGDSFLADRLVALEAIAQERTPPGRKIVDRSKTVPGSVPDYELYRIASDLTHSGMGVVNLYTASDPRKEGRIGFHTSANHPQAASWFSTAAWLLLRALTVWDQLLVARPFEDRLRVIATVISGHS